MNLFLGLLNWSFGFDTADQLQAGLFISLVSVWLLVGVFSYLNYYTRRRYFSIWTVAWLFYSLYLTLCFSFFYHYGSFSAEPWWGTMMKQWCISVSAVFMLWGSLRFLGKKVRQVSLSLLLCFLLVWSFVASYPWPENTIFDRNDRLSLQIPIFVLIGGASIFTVWGFLQYRRRRQFLGAGMLCFGFTLWGLFVAAYPFLESMSQYMSTGFFIASVLQMFIAVNMIILVLEQLRHLREKRAAQQLQRKELEKTVLQTRVILTEARYQTLFEQSNEPIVITTRDDLRIVGLNQAATRLLGTSVDEAQHHSLSDWFCDISNSSKQILDGHSWFEAVCRKRYQQLRRKDGSQVSVEVLGSVIDFEGETALQFYLPEMNDLSRLEHQLRRAEKLSALGQMISGVVHELSNPLAVTSTMIELAMADKQVAKETRNHLISASSELFRAVRMLRNFLKLAREGGVEKELVDLNETIRNVLELRRSEFCKAKVQTITKLDPELTPTKACPDQVQQILIILINNALQAMDGVSGEKILQISTQQELAAVSFRVEDNGPGVPLHLRSRIFEPFFTTKPVGVGTGLGLSVAHTFVMEHQGRIFCAESPLGGASFKIDLPPGQPSAGLNSKTAKSLELAGAYH
jgi:PAS domain S-box-containing protein